MYPDERYEGPQLLKKAKKKASVGEDIFQEGGGDRKKKNQKKVHKKEQGRGGGKGSAENSTADEDGDDDEKDENEEEPPHATNVLRHRFLLVPHAAATLLSEDSGSCNGASGEGGFSLFYQRWDGDLDGKDGRKSAEDAQEPEGEEEGYRKRTSAALAMLKKVKVGGADDTLVGAEATTHNATPSSSKSSMDKSTKLDTKGRAAKRLKMTIGPLPLFSTAAVGETKKEGGELGAKKRTAAAGEEESKGNEKGKEHVREEKNVEVEAGKVDEVELVERRADDEANGEPSMGHAKNLLDGTAIAMQAMQAMAARQMGDDNSAADAASSVGAVENTTAVAAADTKAVKKILAAPTCHCAQSEPGYSAGASCATAAVGTCVSRWLLKLPSNGPVDRPPAPPIAPIDSKLLFAQCGGERSFPAKGDGGPLRDLEDTEEQAAAKGSVSARGSAGAYYGTLTLHQGADAKSRMGKERRRATMAGGDFLTQAGSQREAVTMESGNTRTIAELQFLGSCSVLQQRRQHIQVRQHQHVIDEMQQQGYHHKVEPAAGAAAMAPVAPLTAIESHLHMQMQYQMQMQMQRSTQKQQERQRQQQRQQQQLQQLQQLQQQIAQLQQIQQVQQFQAEQQAKQQAQHQAALMQQEQQEQQQLQPGLQQRRQQRRYCEQQLVHYSHLQQMCQFSQSHVTSLAPGGHYQSAQDQLARQVQLQQLGASQEMAAQMVGGGSTQTQKAQQAQQLQVLQLQMQQIQRAREAQRVQQTLQAQRSQQVQYLGIPQVKQQQRQTMQQQLQQQQLQQQQLQLQLQQHQQAMQQQPMFTQYLKLLEQQRGQKQTQQLTCQQAQQAQAQQAQAQQTQAQAQQQAQAQTQQQAQQAQAQQQAQQAQQQAQKVRAQREREAVDLT
jgi:hypothetical protein